MRRRTIWRSSSSLWREHLDLSEIVASYKSGLGQPPFDPRMMTALLLYALLGSLFITEDREGTRRAGRFHDDRGARRARFRTIADSRKRHLPRLGRLFLQGLKLAEKAGLAKLGHVALDGTKIKANASKHKAMSYERMKTCKTELRAEVDRWPEAAEAADAQEDKLHGASRRGDEMPILQFRDGDQRGTWRPERSARHTRHTQELWVGFDGLGYAVFRQKRRDSPRSV
jgi:transposase